MSNIPKDPCMEYLPTFLGVNVGKYSIHGSSGYVKKMGVSENVV